MEILIPIAVVLLVPVIYVIVQYNGLVAIKNHIRDAWANIDTELKRRYELIPNLVATVKGYAAHEREVLESVIAARNRRSDNSGPVAAQDEMSGEGKSLTVITPFYASQPATKEAVDLFIADAEARGYETKIVDTANDNAAVRGSISSALAQDFDAIILAFAFPPEVGEALGAAGWAGGPFKYRQSFSAGSRAATSIPHARAWPCTSTSVSSTKNVLSR